MATLKYLPGVVTLELDAGKCDGCQLCLIVCPHEVFAIENKRAVIVDRDACMECGACALNCAPGAITVQSGVGCAEAIIRGAVRGGPPTCDAHDTSCGC